MREKRDIRIFIESERYEIESSLFAGDDVDVLDPLCEDGEVAKPERMQIKTHGSLEVYDGRVEIAYDETELTGLEGSRTCVSYGTADVGTVTMLRTGAVSTTLVFEKGKRHHCVYSTPYMPFEVCVRTLDVKNELAQRGTLFIDYIVEIRGARAERTRFSMTVIE